jgi:hypothetical protein
MSHPYQHLADHRYWRQGVAEAASRRLSDVDPVVEAPFQLEDGALIATAGSCFAQHVARHLRLAGVQPLVTERAHPMMPPQWAAACGYGDFSARYGNVYTSRQLHQLLLRALGEFEPDEPLWQNADGRWFDPFRPTIQPGGFRSEAELKADRAQHLAAVRRMFTSLDVLIFTLGLTECWESVSDGAVFPVCPGAAAGDFDARRYRLLNLGVDDTCADLLAFSDRLRAINPQARIVLTVSPVPLVATANDSHVMVATSWSKSVLRVAAGNVAMQRPQVAYFPSYEIITGAYARGAYFASDLRSVNEAGVEHVMRLFLKHYVAERAVGPVTGVVAEAAAPLSQIERMDELVRVHCDEETLLP